MHNQDWNLLLFTGIVEEVGHVTSIARTGGGAKVSIRAQHVIEDVTLGDSIAVNGVCLSVTSFCSDGFCADATPQTMSATNLGNLHPGDLVNLERAVTPSTRLGGHIVTGHVDCLCSIKNIVNVDNSRVFTFAPKATHVLGHITPRGSVTINGVSLTVANIDDSAKSFEVSVIPITLADTNLSNARIGDTVNLETDVLAKYIARLIQVNGIEQSRNTAKPPSATLCGEGVSALQSGSSLTIERLLELGF
jgi:riboflavin synthase